ncbi:MAG TPA: hypothetical protein VF048_07080 [Gemmatimonadaceae bacterium]
MPAIPPDHRLEAISRPGPLDFLAALARRQGDGALALSAGLGLLAAVAAAAAASRWPLLALPALAAAVAAAFGAWGIVDRTAAERRLTHPGTDRVGDTLRALRLLLAAAGVTAAAALALALMTLLLGGGWF